MIDAASMMYLSHEVKSLNLTFKRPWDGLNGHVSLVCMSIRPTTSGFCYRHFIMMGQLEKFQPLRTRFEAISLLSHY